MMWMFKVHLFHLVMLIFSDISPVNECLNLSDKTCSFGIRTNVFFVVDYAQL